MQSEKMSAELATLEFYLADEISGAPLTLETVDLPTLRGFLADVETLIKGDVSGANLSDSRVRIENGSVKVVTMVGYLLAMNAQEDFQRLERTGNLDEIQPKRAEIIEKWISKTHRAPSRTYSICNEANRSILKVTQSTQFVHRNENSWVQVERFLFGKVVDAGGKQNPNVHLVLADSGKSIRVSATEDQLFAERENQLYKEVTLRVLAEQHLETRELRNIQLLAFVPQSMTVDESGLETLWKKGREAWRDITTPGAWVDALRGNA